MSDLRTDLDTARTSPEQRSAVARSAAGHCARNQLAAPVLAELLAMLGVDPAEARR